GEERFGLFIDYPTTLTFDLGFETSDLLKISCEHADLDLYVITGDSALDIVKQFRKLIGRSYIAPKFGFGYGQSRWGYKYKEDFRRVVREHRGKHIPIDMIYMDIDYMDAFKDFTVHPEEFADFPTFVQEMKDEKIHLVPIIDAGVKVEKGYSVYDEGVENDYFCKRADGSNFVATVWPGQTHFPDFLNKNAREWFGQQYKVLIDAGIDGFWNDMNEPAIFHTPERLAALRKEIEKYMEIEDFDTSENPVFGLLEKVASTMNNPEDYKNMYHNVDGKMVNHADVHNLFGYNMTRAAGEAFEKMYPDRRILMFSRSSYVGAHRYGGIWMGDNMSWWSHLLMNLQMLPSLNMTGFLYTGADLGGFGSNTSRDLMLRWLALGVFTPLMRNHSADGTRLQEFFRFDNTDAFESVISVRYRLLPYIYSEYMKAVLKDEMMFKPLAFVYPDDEVAVDVEDQMMIGNEVMIAPVVKQNAQGRFVYLPEEMMLVKFLGDGSFVTEELPQGIHYMKVALDEVPLFIRKGCCIPVAEKAERVDEINTEEMTVVGFKGASYELFEDDGISRETGLDQIRVLSC
ncbi:MAG: alpha-glucosidase, partial [Lachnospiraceae bacterium]|nr:alpha-glucosidase [Lachnospiraceae bacterium]